MKKCSFWKRIAAAAAAIMLIGTMGVSTMANEEFGGAGEDKGSITVHKYSRVTEATVSNPTGEAITDTSGLGTPLSGVGYTLYKLDMSDVTLNEGDSLTDVYETTIAGDNVEVEFTTASAASVTVDATIVVGESFTDEDGVLVFGVNGGASTLDQGYYLLVESTVPSGYTAINPTIVSIPLTNEDGTGYVYDVHVYPKNVSEIPITKILDDTSKTYHVGEDVSFTINAGFSNEEEGDNKVTSINDLRDNTDTTAVYGEMKITDKLVDSLKYKSSTVHYLTDTNQKIALTQEHYALTITNNICVWALTDEGIDLIIDSETANGKGVALVVNIVATVQVSDKALTNKASSYVKKAGAATNPEEKETPDVKVPTGSIKISKIDAADDSYLAGAVFALATNEEGTTFLKKDGTYAEDITNIADLKAIQAELLLVTTDADGKAIFSGLICSDSEETPYRLIEIQSPEGYQLKEAAIEADLPTIGTTPGIEITVVVKNYANGTIDPDNPKFSLPLTGGTGTILFTVIGILIMTTTVVLYNRYKKKNNV